MKSTFVATILLGAGLASAECSVETFGPLCDPMSPEMTQTAPETFQAEFETSQGKFIVEAIRALAPAEADRFYNLVRNGYYDNTKYDLCDGVNGNEVATLIMQPVRYVEHTGAAFYRMVPNFVLQWGPNGDPNLANVYNPTVCDVPGACFRSSPVVGSNLKGTITFSAEGVEDTCTKTNNAALICDEATAGTGPLVLATELFINLNDNSFLDASGFGAFGKVIGDGMAVVESLYSGYGEMQGGSKGDYLCTRDMAKQHYPNASCAGPNPDMLYSMNGGNAYYDAEFPLMSKTISARLVDTTEAVAAAPAATAATAPAASPAADAHGATAGDAAGHDATAAAGGEHAADASSEAYHYPDATPPENPQWPVSAASSVMIGMSIIGALILVGAGAIMGYLLKSAAARKRAGSPHASATEIGHDGGFGAESAMDFKA